MLRGFKLWTQFSSHLVRHSLAFRSWNSILTKRKIGKHQIWCSSVKVSVSPETKIICFQKSVLAWSTLYIKLAKEECSQSHPFANFLYNSIPSCYYSGIVIFTVKTRIWTDAILGMRSFCREKILPSHSPLTKWEVHSRWRALPFFKIKDTWDSAHTRFTGLWLPGFY